MRFLACTLVAAFLASCVHVQSISLTQIPEERSRPIHAEASLFMFLGIAFDSDFVHQAREDLQAQCLGGKVQGILTKHENVNYFLGIFMRRRVVAHAYCVRGTQA